MIKLKDIILTESYFIDRIEQRIEKLEKELDRVDSTGNYDEYRRISKEIEELRNSIEPLKKSYERKSGGINDKKIKEIETPPPQPPAIMNTQIQTNFSKDFINFIKKIENSTKTGFKNGKWFPSPSIEGGLPTISYGHKIKDNTELKNMTNGITDSKATELLIDDLNKAKETVHEYIKNKYGVYLLLDKVQEEMLVEFAFNLGGLSKFPKFVDAVLRKQWNIVKKEYKRGYTSVSGEKKMLSGRNNEFYNRYLANV
jgi:GH24 family phage-related lysozyme (muramidase)